jgi:LEA14-like dessication related protein
LGPWLAWLLFLLVLDSCSSLPLLTVKPEVKKVSVSLVGLDFRKVDLRFDVEVENAGAGSLAVAGYDYDLAIEGQPFLKGRSEAGFELKPHAMTTISVPISIRLADLFRQASSLLGRSDAAYSMTVGFLVKTPAGPFRLPFQKEGLLPLLPSRRS